MPIRPEIRQFYDAPWRKFRLTALAVVGHRCQRCGRPHLLLNVAHLSHDPADRQLLAVLCPSCHTRNDTPHLEPRLPAVAGPVTGSPPLARILPD
jgi:hypothetical protein